MRPDLPIAQCLVVAGPAGPACVARSDGFPFAWEDAARTAAARFGRRPPGVACPAAVFAVPVGGTHVAVVQVADQGAGGAADPPLGFRFLVLARTLYDALGDPFAVADRFPPDWSARVSLPALAWPPEPLPRRTADGIHRMLKGDAPPAADAPPRDNSLLLGGVQALLDGGRLAVERAGPDDRLVRGLWQLLPDRTRSELWPASFAFAADLGFHAVALPPGTPPPPGYLSEDQARDYPEGRYELALQIAAEAGDQAELDRLFARRTSRDTLRLAAYLLGAAVLAAVVNKLFL